MEVSNVRFWLLTLLCTLVVAGQPKSCQMSDGKAYCHDLRLSDENIDELFDSLPYNLTTLSLRDNQFSYFPAFEYRTKDKFLTVRRLYLNENYLHSLPKHLSNIFPNLEELHLSSNSIRWPYDELTGLSKLKVLSLKRNRLRSIPKNIFANLISLERLELQLNSLNYYSDYCPDCSSIHYKSFTGLRNLTCLDLRYNQIRVFDDGVFSLLTNPNLYIDLSHNWINGISKNTFKSNRTMRKIDFRFNKIKTVHKEAFDRMAFTDPDIGLDLSHNMLKKVPEALLQMRQGHVSLLNNTKLQYTACEQMLYTSMHKNIDLFLPIRQQTAKQCPQCNETYTIKSSCYCKTAVRGICRVDNKTHHTCACAEKRDVNTYISSRKSDSFLTNNALNAVGVCVSIAAALLLIGLAIYIYKILKAQRRAVERTSQMEGERTSQMEGEDDNENIPLQEQGEGSRNEWRL